MVSFDELEVLETLEEEVALEDFSAEEALGETVEEEATDDSLDQIYHQIHHQSINTKPNHQLHTLYLANLSGYLSIQHYQSLTCLHLNSSIWCNEIEFNNVMQQISHLTCLKTLSLSSCQFKDQLHSKWMDILCQSISQLNNLETLDLSHIKFTAEIIIIFSQYIQQELYFHQSLLHLNLSSCNIGPEEMEYIDAQHRIYTSLTFFITSLSYLKNLITLNLANNSLSIAFIISLCQHIYPSLSSLSCLNLDLNYIEYNQSLITNFMTLYQAINQFSSLTTLYLPIVLLKETKGIHIYENGQCIFCYVNEADIINDYGSRDSLIRVQSLLGDDRCYATINSKHIYNIDQICITCNQAKHEITALSIKPHFQHTTCSSSSFCSLTMSLKHQYNQQGYCIYCNQYNDDDDDDDDELEEEEASESEEEMLNNSKLISISRKVSFYHSADPNICAVLSITKDDIKQRKDLLINTLANGLQSNSTLKRLNFQFGLANDILSLTHKKILLKTIQTCTSLTHITYAHHLLKNCVESKDDIHADEIENEIAAICSTHVLHNLYNIQ